MSKPQSLAEFLGAADPRPEGEVPTSDFEQLIDVSDAKEFCQRIMKTREWRQYIMNGIVLGDLPSAIATRIMDHGIGKPPDKVEVTGKDGQPIETVTEVRRVVVHAPKDEDEPSDKVVH